MEHIFGDPVGEIESIIDDMNIRKRLLEQIRRLSEENGMRLQWDKLYAEDIDGLEKCLRVMQNAITNR